MLASAPRTMRAAAAVQRSSSSGGSGACAIFVPGFLEDGRGSAGEVLERRLAAERGELLARDAVAELGLVAEREERLVAAGSGAGAGDRQHLVEREVGTLAPPRGPGEGAVVADVAAERRERDEDLGRVRDEGAVPVLPKPARLRAEL